MADAGVEFRREVFGGLAAAYAVHNGLTALDQTRHFMHGRR
jgi:glycerol dehydrogenase-like iron-containing ADH family enzyme